MIGEFFSFLAEMLREAVVRWILAGMALCFGLLIWADYRSEQAWKVFSAAHECKVVARIRGGVSNGLGITSSGKTVITTSTEADKTGYLCSDGITYYR